MPRVTLIDPEGTRHELDGLDGMSVMEVAVRNGVPGIKADCGGACACATCQVYVDADWMERVGAPTEMEADMLEFAVDPAANSRLSCQIRLTAALDGMIAHVPASQ